MDMDIALKTLYQVNQNTRNLRIKRQCQLNLTFHMVKVSDVSLSS